MFVAGGWGFGWTYGTVVLVVVFVFVAGGGDSGVVGLVVFPVLLKFTGYPFCPLGSNV